MIEAATASTATGSVPAMTVPSARRRPCLGPSPSMAVEAVDQADPRLHERSEGNERACGLLDPFQPPTLGAGKPHSARDRS